MTDEMSTDAVHLAEYILIHAESNLLAPDVVRDLNRCPAGNITAVPVDTLLIENNRTKDIVNKCKNFIAKYKGKKPMSIKIPLTQVYDDFKQVCIL